MILERITKPGGLTSTRQFPTAEMKDHLMPGHEDGHEVSHWDFQALAGCAALYSSANDLLRYANLFFSNTNEVHLALGGGDITGNEGDNDLAAAVELATRVHYQNQKEGECIGLAWQIEDVDGTDIYSHSGATGGFCSYLAFNKENRRAVVVLSNSTADVESIGTALSETVLVAP
jgi:CubicO group peptidase (beta-lactamase class C family)